MKKILFNPLFFLLIILNSLSSCKKDTLFEQLSASKTGINFNNIITHSDSLNALTFEYIYNGGGVGIGDFNNDGLQDVFFSGNQVSSRLYLNKGNLTFKEVTNQAKVNTNRWCTGVSIVDINHDGKQDIYVCVAGMVKDTTQRANLLFVNKGNDEAGVPIFEEQAKQLGLDDMGYSTQAAFIDYDHDGDLDCYVLTNALERQNRNAIRPKRLSGEAPSNDRLYQNTPNGFVNVSRKAGILTEGYGLGIAVADLNGDGWDDIYCANDFLSNDLVWINNRNGTFTNQAAELLKHQTHNAMGVDIADINNDALPDIMVVDMLPNTNQRQKMMLPGYNYDRFKMDLRNGYQAQYMRNTLQLNGLAQQGGNHLGGFQEIAQLAGVEKTDWSWAPLFADFDNDGFKDLFITNGYRRDVTNLDFTAYLADLGAGGFGDADTQNKKATQKLNELPEVKLPNFCYRNKGDLTFEDVSEKWGFDSPSYSNGAAYADLDNDGDLDIVINNIDDAAMVYENKLNQKAEQSNHWLRVELHDIYPTFGTKITVFVGRTTQIAEQNPVRGFVSSVETTLHFGLNKSLKIDSIWVNWTNGQKQIFRNIKADQTFKIKREGVINENSLPTYTPIYFDNIELNTLNIKYRHRENEFNDFAETPILPHKHSQNGPPLVAGDINNDGLDDFYVGADAGQNGQLFMQLPNGAFKSAEIPKNNNQEDVSALFFDMDNDHDLDLYVVSGGSHAGGQSEAYQDRIYENKGNGNFLLRQNILPNISTSGSCAVAFDYDKDGDLDLFRGGRLIPGRYPMPASSMILRNNGVSKFTDETAKIAPELLNIGLVTGAVVADFDQDDWQDIALVGEWMPLIILKNQRGKALKRFSPLQIPEQAGWFNTLAAADFDHDGDIDLMAGNLGLNSKHKATPQEPLEIWASDFDDNGHIDPIMTYYNKGKRYLTPTRDILALQIPSIKRRFPDFETYAKATFEECFTKKELQNTTHKVVNELRSLYMENKGKGQFIAVPLPIEAQFAPVFGILIDDFNQDRNLDALLIGNSYAPETIGGWYDASDGTLLLGNGKGNFTTAKNTGLLADKDAKQIIKIRQARNKSLILWSNNNDFLQGVRLKK